MARPDDIEPGEELLVIDRSLRDGPGRSGGGPSRVATQSAVWSP